MVAALVTGAFSAVLYILVTAMLSTFDSRGAFAPHNSLKEPNGNSEYRNPSVASDNTRDTSERGLASVFLDRRARTLALVIRAATLVVGILSFAYATLPQNGSAAFLIIAGTAGFIGGAMVHLVIFFLTSRFRDNARSWLFPLVKIFNLVSYLPGISSFLNIMNIKPRKTGGPPDDETNATIREGLELLEDASLIPSHDDELRMIRSILRMDAMKVKEIMRPRPDVVAASLDTSLEQVANMMTGGGYSKIPVYKESLDDVQGIVHARDILSEITNFGHHRNSLADLVKPAISVPETQDLDTLQKVFRDNRASVALVFDEHGGFSGIVTFTDLAEEIFGEMMDEFDQESPEIEKVSDDEIMADATITIDQLNQALGTHVEPNGVDTVGGIVYQNLAHMPRMGDSVVEENLAITVLSVSGRRVLRVKVKKVPSLRDSKDR